ncbi:alkaline phosphatase family protein [Zunongwangia sp. HGR-M22]|uniref:alkaline phosphatase family protein n=1 Tax=Zunongwangia sp. HGR-M22 TaxID=3015168 RepID=UPI0022DDDB09|nr:ectonucleotide pyrophosphatase/phosphodiesterase [Zunongwangia sp. HGR-M22]WBL26835.1 ectonucleotide pyrophosphatase/phosphodiesterase [Zunongwangia sp. HGR-M22]
MKSVLIFGILILNFLSGFGQQAEPGYVLLVSFDGFRHDYVEKYDAKNLKEFIKKGAAAESLIPGFPSKTFPNHYSIVTGLYPGNHGLVANSFYDSIKNTTYKIGKRELVEDPFYYRGTPLWQLTQQNGYKAASYFWVGSEAPIKGSFPDYYFTYDGKVPNKKRIRQVVKWLELPEQERPHFISLYFSLVDSEGHHSGPNSKALARKVKEADKLVGFLMNKLEEIDLPVDVIITSDHGMKEVKPKTNSVDPQHLLKLIPEEATVVPGQIITQIYLPKIKIQVTYSKLKRLESHFKVYKKGEMPKIWHYDDHYRIGDLVILTDPGFIFNNRNLVKTGGVHGYDPSKSKEMHGILYAQGPHITKGIKTESLENVNIYPLITKILGFENPEIDGEFENIKDFYKSE